MSIKQTTSGNTNQGTINETKKEGKGKEGKGKEREGKEGEGNEIITFNGPIFECCAVCIESYKVSDLVRILPCR